MTLVFPCFILARSITLYTLTTAVISCAINGITSTQTVDPGIEEVLGIGTQISNFIGTAFNTSVNIYTRVTPCFSLQLNPDGNNTMPPNIISCNYKDVLTGRVHVFDLTNLC
jgi:hypothetical protein